MDQAPPVRRGAWDIRNESRGRVWTVVSRIHQSPPKGARQAFLERARSWCRLLDGLRWDWGGLGTGLNESNETLLGNEVWWPTPSERKERTCQGCDWGIFLSIGGRVRSSPVNKSGCGGRTLANEAKVGVPRISPPSLRPGKKKQAEGGRRKEERSCNKAVGAKPGEKS